MPNQIVLKQYIFPFEQERIGSFTFQDQSQLVALRALQTDLSKCLYADDVIRNVEINMPLIVRLQGTNAEEGKRILDESGLAVQSAILFQEAADKVNAALA